MINVTLFLEYKITEICVLPSMQLTAVANLSRSMICLLVSEIDLYGLETELILQVDAKKSKTTRIVSVRVQQRNVNKDMGCMGKPYVRRIQNDANSYAQQ